MLANFIWLLGAVATPKWVTQDGEWTGAVLEVSESDIDWLDEDPYLDLKEDDSDICDSPQDIFEGMCDTISKLHTAGAVYVFFTVLSFLVVVGWAVHIVLEILQKQLLPNFVGFIWPACLWVFHFMGFVCWAGVSEATFAGKDECEDVSVNDDETVCAIDGPDLALFIIFWLTGVCGVWVFFWIKKGSAVPSDDPRDVNANAGANDGVVPPPANPNDPAAPAGQPAGNPSVNRE
jgi:hypothetical protein